MSSSDYSQSSKAAFSFSAISPRGYTEAVVRLTNENIIRVLENVFWRLGEVPPSIVFDNTECAVNQAEGRDPELDPKIVEFSKHYGWAPHSRQPTDARRKGKGE
ncbi:transposase [Roseiconus nitratireducens]|uniref:Transposase n=1 Tax=Roseiconus nitratireducens TaxID=2605748 RepID=A0A5M6DAC9_9BACT|nr:transposase [Roseiconus nitratireducens]KAA5542165.1 transposase [Roseiconus nitratireducens]